MEPEEISISAKAAHAIAILSVIQATKEHLARLLGIDLATTEKILFEIRSVGLQLSSGKSEDDRLYYWMEKP